MDSITHRPRPGRPGTSGVILVLRDSLHPEPGALVGRYALIVTTLGTVICARIKAVRDHGKTISVLIENQTREGIPIDSKVTILPASQAGELLSTGALREILRQRLPTTQDVAVSSRPASR